jgi:ankyrin repeat protein
LEQKQLNINALNSDGFSVLDFAVLATSNRTITKLLLQYGAQSGNFPTENIDSHLSNMLSDAEKKLAHIVTSIESAGQNCSGMENERRKSSIEQRIKLIKRMINGWKRLQVPDSPFSFTIGIKGN